VLPLLPLSWEDGVHLCYNINMNSRNEDNKKGFTLIEAILYLAIAGTVLYFVSGFAFNSIFGKAKIETIQDINQNSRSVLDQISSAVGDAVEINGVQ
jgi:type II secretory pathway pseudopilin PulG